MQSLKTYKKPVNHALAAFLFFVTCAGLVLTAFAINLYESTFVPFAVCLSIYLVPALVITPVLLRLIFRQRPKYVVWKCFVISLSNVIGIGGVLLYAFLAINFYDVDDSRQITQKLSIVSTGYRKYRDSKIPYANIRYQGQVKGFEFPTGGPPLTDFNFLQMEINHGYFGFDVVKDIKLVK
jgi:hypothetical protein